MASYAIKYRVEHKEAPYSTVGSLAHMLNIPFPEYNFIPSVYNFIP